MQIIIMVLLHFQKLIKKLILLWVKNYLAVCIIFVINTYMYNQKAEDSDSVDQVEEREEIERGERKREERKREERKREERKREEREREEREKEKREKRKRKKGNVLC